MSCSATKHWPGPASWCARSPRALGGGCLPTQHAHTARFHCVTFPNPLIILGPLDNTFHCFNIPPRWWALPESHFWQQLLRAQVTEMLCSCTRACVSHFVVVWHPGGCTSPADHPQATNGFPSKADLPTEGWSTLTFLSSLMRGGGHVTVFRPRWALVLSAQHACHPKQLQPTGPYIHRFKQQEHFSC